MSRRKQSVKSQSKTARRDPIPWKYCFLTLACGLMLVAGFFFAARSHFASIEYGIKNSKLRKQVDELEADKRRLILSKEIALSPAEIKKAAMKIGLTEMTAANIEVYRPAPPREKSKTEKLITEKPKLEFLEKAEPVKKEEKKPETKVEKKAEKQQPEAKEKKKENKVQIAKK